MSNVNDLGPLPKVDRNRDLQELSIRALHASLPVDAFLSRDERIHDYGVDLSLELLISGCATNMRAQVQMKGTESLTENSDGSISLPVEASNLNYLLSGPSPLYILHREPQHELRYVWAFDEKRRIATEKPDWLSHDRVTLRFSRRLDASGLADVHQRVQREARVHRQLTEVLGASTARESVTITIDVSTMTFDDPETLRRVLRTSGFTITASGFPSHVRRMVASLGPDVQNEPRLQLVDAYASYVLGNYTAADALCRAVRLRLDELDDGDQRFLRCVANACEYHTGRLTIAEYLDREQRLLDGGPELLQQQHRLRRLRLDFLDAREPDRRSALLQEIRGLVHKIESSSAVSPHSRFESLIVLVEVEGHENSRRFRDDVFKAAARKSTGRPLPLSALFASAAGTASRWSKWLISAGTLLDEAAGARHPLVAAHALSTRARIGTDFVAEQRLIAAAQGRAFRPDAGTFEPLMRDAEAARQLYSTAAALEGELTALMILCDLFALRNQMDAAKMMAIGALPKAEAMMYSGIIDRAQRHRDGRWEVLEAEVEFEKFRAEDDDFSFAESTDDQIRDFARECMRTQDLPKDRLPIVEQECFSLRAIAREHVHWCRHLELTQDLRHTWNDSTLYANDPMRWAICTALDLRSPAASTDWNRQIGEFKRTHCGSCSSRSPKAAK